MPNDYDIENGVLKRYRGTEYEVYIPRDVTKIGAYAFQGCESICSVTIPDGVTEIGSHAFLNCKNLFQITIPDSVSVIGDAAFGNCEKLIKIAIPDGVEKIGFMTFAGCGELLSIDIPDSVTIIGEASFKKCTALHSFIIPESVTEIDDKAFESCMCLNKVTIPDGVTRIGAEAFKYCRNLKSIVIPNSVTMIGPAAFSHCLELTSVSLSDSLTEISDKLFENCSSLTSVTIPDGVLTIGEDAFSGCSSLASVSLPDSLKTIKSGAFLRCYELTVIKLPDSVTEIGKEMIESSIATFICREGSYVNRYCSENRIPFIFDYQYEAFGGLVPQGVEMLLSPFLADEERPFIFISYSHKDRDAVLEIIKTLYESGWKIWYDEGLTIGDKYDETLETHVKNCSAFLLFVTENSLNSMYVKENEIPWAIDFKKPIIKCILTEGLDYEIEEEAVVATVSQSGIETALKKVGGLTKGERREAKGVSVAVNPMDRGDDVGDGFAYCLYAESNSATAKVILLEANNSGCNIYNASENGEDDEKLRDSACLIVFLDKEFLSDEHLTGLLIREFKREKDIAVCLLEDVQDEELPAELLALHKMQWLNYAHGINADMNTKLARHLQKRGCRDTSVLPGFEYEETEKGIVIKKYTGMGPNPRIESEYGGIPVAEIAKEAFRNCIAIKSVTVPDGVKTIGERAFEGCKALTSVALPDSVTAVEFSVFKNCESLNLVVFGNRLQEVGAFSFFGCKSLTSVVIPDSVTTIEMYAFEDCSHLTSVDLSKNIKIIRAGTFRSCKELRSVTIPNGVTRIGPYAFSNCTALTSVTVPNSVKSIDIRVFDKCPNLTVMCSPSSFAWKYCIDNNVPVKPRSGFLGKLFDKK